MSDLGLNSVITTPKYPSASVKPASQALESKGEKSRGSLEIFNEL